MCISYIKNMATFLHNLGCILQVHSCKESKTNLHILARLIAPCKTAVVLQDILQDICLVILYNALQDDNVVLALILQYNSVHLCSMHMKNN